MTQKEPRKHHYIPQFYLRNFSFKEKRQHQCICYNIKEQKIIQTNITNVATKKDLFTKIGKDGKKNVETEKNLAKKEYKMALSIKTIIDKVKNNKNIEKNDLEEIIKFISLQITRSVSITKEYDKHMSKILEDIIKPLETEPLNQDFDFKKLKESIKKNVTPFLIDNFDLNKVEKIISQKNRYFLKIDEENISFITSDMPLYRNNLNPKEKNGIKYPNTSFTIPLSEKIFLLIYGNGNNIKIISIKNKELIRELNGFTASNASQFIMGKNKKLIEKISERIIKKNIKYIHSKNNQF